MIVPDYDPGTLTDEDLAGLTRFAQAGTDRCPELWGPVERCLSSEADWRSSGEIPEAIAFDPDQMEALVVEGLILRQIAIAAVQRHGGDKAVQRHLAAFLALAAAVVVALNKACGPRPEVIQAAGRAALVVKREELTH